MPATDLHHLAIKTADVSATAAFWNNVLGSRTVDRPDFDFPGAWLQFGSTMIHLYGGHAATNRDGGHDRGAGAIDHVALSATGFDDMRQRLIAEQFDWRQNDIPSFGIWQLFVHDPNGILVELNFNSANEPGGSEGPGDGNLYVAGEF